MKVQNISFQGYTAGTKIREAFDNAKNDRDLKTTDGRTAGVKIREAFANAEAEMNNNTTNPVRRTRPSIEETKKSTQEKQLDEIAFQLSYIGSQMKALVDLKTGKQPEKRVKGLDRV